MDKQYELRVKLKVICGEKIKIKRELSPGDVVGQSATATQNHCPFPPEPSQLSRKRLSYPRRHLEGAQPPPFTKKGRRDE